MSGFQYVYRFKRPPGLKMVLGISAHTALEQDLAHKVKSWEHLPREQVVDTFVDEFKKEAVDAKEEPEKKLTKGIMQDSGVRAVGVWYDKVAPGTDPMMVEQHGQFEIDGIPYDWTADVIEHDERIRDWKFTGRKPSGRQEYVLNMVGYAIGYRHMTGRIETGVQLDYMVRTKEPYHYPITGPTVPDQSIEAFSDIVQTAYRSIDAGIFPPTGLKSGACGWCQFADGTCPAYGKGDT